MIRLTGGITPDARTLRRHTRHNLPSATHALDPCPARVVDPDDRAAGLLRQFHHLDDFSLMTSPSDPSNTVKSWLKTPTPAGPSINRGRSPLHPRTAG